MDKYEGSPTSKDAWISDWGDGLRVGTEKLPPWFNLRWSYFIYIFLIIIILLFLFLNTYLIYFDVKINYYPIGIFECIWSAVVSQKY